MINQIDEKTSKIEVFFDGGCPLCVREIRLLQHWDRRGKIMFTNIHEPSFPAADIGKSYAELMARMHGRLPEGTWVTGVEVFRRMYAAVGFGPLVWISRWPLISQLLDVGYVVFARNRLWLTGRCKSGTCSNRFPAVPTSETSPAILPEKTEAPARVADGAPPIEFNGG